MTARRLITSLLLVIALAAPAAAQAQDNNAIAINTKDDSSLFELAFSVKEVGGEVIDQQNAAVAYSNCQECQTVAIAIQVLIVTATNPDVVTPTNIAVAVNENCDTCTTMALAYQFVVGGAGLELTKRGKREIKRIRRELRRLGRHDLSAAEIRDRTAALVQRLRQVLATELVPRRDRRGEDDDDDDDDERERRFEDEEEPEDGAPRQGPDGGGEPPTGTTPVEPPGETTPAEPAPQPQGTSTAP